MSLPARQQRVINEMENALRASEPLLASMYAIVLVPVLFTICGATATGQAGSAAKSAGAARFVTRTASEQALSPPSATSDTSGVC